MSDTSRRELFYQGYEAFRRTFPGFEEKLGNRPFYVCPQCLRGYSEEAIVANELTLEHVPPESVGGRKLVLTCAECNHSAGHAMDSHMKLEGAVIDFLANRQTTFPATIRTESGRLPVNIKVDGKNILAVGVPKAAHPQDRAGIEKDFNRASTSGGWKDFTFKVDFPRFNSHRAEASWLRAAYLAFFAACGYRFICRQEMQQVRERIAAPKTKTFPFRIIRPEAVAEPVLATCVAPEAFRSFAMVYDRHVIFLPVYGDSTLYDRLKHQSGHYQFRFENVYAFPDRAQFLHDLPRKKSA